jgi:ribulose-bisphosphate carboxylase large chain
MKEDDFVNLNYKPTSEDLICLFRVEPAFGVSMKKACANVALESSIGTWTEVDTEKDYMKKLAAKVFSIKGNMVKIAYPSALFEKGNAPNILSSIAGNIFGMKIVKNLRLEDIQFPASILRSFRGPKFGVEGIRNILKVKNRPLLGTIVKPKLGLRTEDHAKVAYEAWVGGCDFVKDDENLSSQDFNKFEHRLIKTLEMAEKAKSETGEEKVYFVNVTAETEEMLRRAELVKSHGGKAVMIDVITEGFGAVQTLRKVDLGLAIHGHRAMHAAFTRNKKHGISMIVLADLCRLIGIDSLHIGTAIGKLEGSLKEVSEIEEEIEQKKVGELRDRLSQNWKNIKPTLAVSSGGLHPGHVPFLIKNLGKDLIIQMGGGIHGHPGGTRAGAMAARQAIDACMKKISLKEYAKTHEELKSAIEHFR